MNEEQYTRLVGTCDEVLLANDRLNHTAVAWLHVLREHPTVLEQYGSLFTSVSAVEKQMSKRRRLRSLLRKVVSGVSAFAENIRKSLVSRKLFRRPLANDVDILFVSHMINPGLAGKPYDFYYGNIPDQLRARGRKVLIVMLNHTDADPGDLEARWSQGDIKRIILPTGGPRGSQIAKAMRSEALYLKRLALREESEFKRKILKRATVEAQAEPSLSALAIGDAIGRLVGITKARSVVLTYEGHAWERIAWASARKYNPGVRCIGYHQACLFKLQHAIRRPLAPRFNPDHVLTAGPITARILTRTPALQGLPVSVMGSDRGEGIESPHGPLVAMRKENFESHPTVLVMPEGMLGECKILFQFALKAAAMLPSVSFRWRLHPLLSFSEIARQFPEFNPLPLNVILSTEPLEKDLELSHWVLYRGTTAVFKAVLSGLRPLYVSQIDELSIDSLFEMTQWKRVLTTTQEFKAVIEADQKRQGAEEEFGVAHEYCRTYFAPLNALALESAALGSNGSDL